MTERKPVYCVRCNKELKIQDQPPESPRKGKLGWYCTYECWFDVEGPVE